MATQRRLAVGLKKGHVDGDFHWVDVKGDAAANVAPARRDPLRASRGVLIAVPFAILLWVLALGAAGFAVLG